MQNIHGQKTLNNNASLERCGTKADCGGSKHREFASLSGGRAPTISLAVSPHSKRPSLSLSSSLARCCHEYHFLLDAQHNCSPFDLPHFEKPAKLIKAAHRKKLFVSERASEPRWMNRACNNHPCSKRRRGRLFTIIDVIRFLNIKSRHSLWRDSLLFFLGSLQSGLNPLELERN
jgi:hypothetical protein